MKYFSLFTGIGGFELGIQQAYENSRTYRSEETRESYIPLDGNIPSSAVSMGDGRNEQPVCVGYSEVDKYAIQIYQKHFPKHTNYGDITKINEKDLPDFDLLVGGFPCQAFSIAGKRKGFEDTRGTLFFDIARILRAKQPRLLLLENVKGLLSHDNGETFKTIISALDELGYDLQWQVLNSKDFGVPQNRERVLIAGHSRKTPRPQVFPITGTDGKDTRNVGEDLSYAIDANYHKGTNTLEKGRRQLVQLNQPRHSNDRVYSPEGISPTLNTMQGGNRQPFVAMQWRRSEKGKAVRKQNMKNGKDYTPFSNEHRELVPHPSKPIGTLTAQAIAKDSLLGTMDNMHIRRLTPIECERLQGFPDGWTEGLSDTQRYKTLGNAVTVNVIKDVMERMLYTPLYCNCCN